MHMELAKIAVLIACHKAYTLPTNPCYLPIEVGAALHERPIRGLISDCTGGNISAKNKNYCELTALYWAWKNLETAYIGLVHYRRYFAVGRRIAGEPDYMAVLAKVPVILPKPRHYWIETNYSQYVHAHHIQDLTLTRKILEERFPQYIPAYDSIMKRRSGHRFNMLVMRHDLLDAYCTWLFSILFEVEARLDTSDYDAYDARVFGFLAERLLDVWIETNHIAYAEMRVKYTESQNWLRKGTSFLLRKFGYRRKRLKEYEPLNV